MFERYTEEARRALFFARYEASQNGSMTIETGHLLLGLMRGRKGRIDQLLGGATLDSQARIELLRAASRPVGGAVDIPFSAQTKQALLHAGEEADRLLHNYIGAEHLLLGLLRVDQSDAATFLVRTGRTLDSMRKHLVELLQKKELETESRAPRGVLQRGSLDPDATLAERQTIIQVSISPAGTSGGGAENSTPGFWSFSSTTLKQLLVILCECRRERLDLLAALDNDRRYDISFTHPPSLSRAIRSRLLLASVEAHFRVTVVTEMRSMETWVLTAPSGPGSALKPVLDAHGPGVGHGNMKYVVPKPTSPDDNFGYGGIDSMSMPFGEAGVRQRTIQSLSFAGATMNDLAAMLEGGLSEPVVDETGLTGRYKIDVATESLDLQDSLRQLLDPLGLAMTRARRDVPIVVVTPIGERRS